jgi:hypothetical protein
VHRRTLELCRCGRAARRFGSAPSLLRPVTGSTEGRRGSWLVMVLDEPYEAMLIVVVRQQVEPNRSAGPCRMRS